MDGRFNPYAVRDEDIAYVSPSTVYAVLRRHGLVGNEEGEDIPVEVDIRPHKAG